MTLQPASGARDLNPQQVRKNHLIASKLSSLYQLWGYQRISPPHIERIDTLMAAGGISSNEILKIVADEPVGLRPEITASIVRAASTRFKEYERPLRFWSTGTSFKCNQGLDGGIDIEESFQSGVELIGTKAINAEIELLSLLLESLKTVKINDSYKTTLLIGNTHLLKLILTSFEPKEIPELNEIICQLDFIRLHTLDMNEEKMLLVKKIMNMRGEPMQVLSSLKEMYGTNSHIENLEELFTIIKPLAINKDINIQLDPTLTTKYRLYSGLTFELISSSDYRAPIVIAKGGRYDDLVKKFSSNSKNSYGIGFSFSIDKLRELITTNHDINFENKKVLIAYKQSSNLNKALKRQQSWHKKGIISVISNEPFSNNDTKQLLKSNRCTEIEWID